MAANMPIENKVWKPTDWQARYGFQADKEYCRYSVWPANRHHSHQCTYQRKVDIEGYGFCSRHAKMLKDMGHGASNYRA